MRIIFSKLPLILFVMAVFAAVWLVGALSARFNVFPYPQLNELYVDLKAIHRSNNFHRATYDFVGTKTHLPDQVAPGLTLLTTLFPEHDWDPGVQIIDSNGTILHDWKLDFDDLFPGRTVAASPIHGAYLFPNGDLLFNLSYVGIARVDRCGKKIWSTKEGKAHHSISLAAGGNFWVPGLTPRRKTDEDLAYMEKFGGLRPPIFEDLFVKISPDGEILKSISSLDVLKQNDLMYLLYRNGSRSRGAADDPGYHGDILHLNDVEELPPEIADSYPLFEAGDLMVSLRQISSVLVFDPDTLEVRWVGTNPLIMQHDPDFMGDGKVGVFNNNTDRTARGTFLGGSKILAFEPHTGTVEQLYPTEKSPHFYTAFAGRWQLLPNGNYLTVESRSGRALEANPAGETVWEWYSERMDGTHVPEVLEATRYDISPETVAGWTCSN
jgi:hypothetical protein